MNPLTRIRRRLQLGSLAPITQAVINDRLTYLEIDKLRRMERALLETRGLAGDLLEFGVALGGSGILLAHGAGPKRRFLGFDVFGMIPPPLSDEDDPKSKDRYETIKSGQSKGIGNDEYYGYREDLIGDVKAAFARHNVPVDDEKIILHQGLFEESWPNVDVLSIALAHIDCDWYDPVKYCLEACADKMEPGGVIIIDDYHAYGGCRTAVDRFIAVRDDFMFENGSNPFLWKRAWDRST